MKTIPEVSAFLDELGVGYTIAPSTRAGGGTSIVCKEGDKNVGGYTFFYTVFDFDTDGNFVEIGAYE